MKKILLVLIFSIGMIYTSQAQEVKGIPFSRDVAQLGDGWHKFQAQGASFDVEVLGGRLIQGNVTWLDGTKYSGSLTNNYITGRGTYTWPNGTRYEGSFKKSERSGKGSMYEKDGTKWSGKWKNNEKNGKGKIFDKEGNLISKGVWENNKLVEK